MTPAKIPLPDLAALDAMAAKLAPLLRKGDFVALEGPLGAGKTAFARSLLRKFGVTGEVPSPTFTLMQIYDTAAFPVYHFDLYRLKNAGELEELGWDEAMGNGLMLVEWPERAGNRVPPDRLDLSFAADGKQERALHIQPFGAWLKRMENFR